MKRQPKTKTRPSAATMVAISATLLLLAACNGSSGKKDTKAPTVTIETPTTAPNYLTRSSPISLAGTASDNRKVVSIEWENAATGATGTASGTETWTADVVLVLGANVITVTALDKRGNAGTDTITVTLDDVAPTLTIDTPTASPTYLTDTTPVALGGVASDNDLVNVVTWTNADTSGLGTAMGTTSWGADVPLTPGDNSITVSAEDLAGNTGTDSITVTLDVMRPLVVIDTPTTALTYASPWTPVTIGGTVLDDIGVATVAWANAATGDSGAASGTSTWTVVVDLAPGSNAIHVTATDLVGRADDARILVTLCEGPASSFGENGSGQLGDGTLLNRTTPSPVTGLAGVTAVAAGNLHTAAILCDGTVWHWGSASPTPTPVTDPSDPSGFLTGVMAIAAGSNHTVALKADGTVRAWGQNDEGQLGDGTVSGGSPTPVQVVDPSDPSGLLTDVVDIAGGGGHTIALIGDGTVRSWGRNADGQLGNGTSTPSPTPVQVVDPSDPSGFLTGVADVSAHIAHSLAALADGTVRAWGFNDKGRLGDGTTTSRSSPVQVVDPADLAGLLSGAVAVAAGQEFSTALLGDGTVRSWGRNLEGQIGDGTITERHSAVAVIDPLDPSGLLTGVTEIAAGWSHVLAVIGRDRLRGWGSNLEGRLGDGTTVGSMQPVWVVDPTDPTGFLTGVTAVAAGGSHSVAVQ